MTSDHLIGLTLDGRYRIEALIARGGMATVYVASDLRLRRNVAVKVMHASLAEDPDFVHRFEREAHAAAQLTNPHVVAVHDQGRDAETGAIYLVMEYVVGRTVRELIGTRGSLTQIQALAVLDPVLQALAAAHDAGFVHRDVKPENVIIGDDGRIKVTDFGLARAIVSSPLSAATQGVLIGTVAYLSPEQVERGFADARSDVYGAGVLLYEMLTGRVPHSGETPLAVAYQHVHSDVQAPSLLNPIISPVVDEVVLRATRRDAEERYQDAREFLVSVRATRSAIDDSYNAAPIPAPETSEIEAVVQRHTITNRTSDPVQHLPEPAEVGTEPDAPSAKQRRRRLPMLLLLAAVLACAGGAGWWFTAGTHSTVPSIIGVQLSDAQAALASASLTATTTEQWSKSVAEGAVIDAQPIPGTSVRHGTSVTLVVSKGPERYKVPELPGLTVDEATIALTSVKLTLGKTTMQYDDQIAPGVIISSNPTAGQVSHPGDVVDLVVSKGPAPIAVPSLSGKSLATATSTLQSLGFSASSATEYSDNLPNGSVIRSEPGSGTLLQRGSHVKLIVSKGPAPVRIPDVFKQSQSKAESLLKAAGLQVKVLKSSGRLLGLVKSQSPAAGSVVPKGSTVTITIV